MSIFSAIKDAIFGSAAQADEIKPEPAGAAPASPASPSASAPSTAPSSTPSSPPASTPAASAKSAMSKVDVAAVLDKLEEQSDEDDIDWRKSIVDLMKILKLDSSLKARKQLAQELKYDGNMKDSSAMNVWLHKQVMLKLAENGGIVPAELKK